MKISLLFFCLIIAGICSAQTQNLRIKAPAIKAYLNGYPKGHIRRDAFIRLVEDSAALILAGGCKIDSFMCSFCPKGGGAMRNYVVVKGNKLNAQVMPFVKGARLGDVFSFSLYLECPDKAHIVKNVGFFLSIANDDR